MSEFPKYRKPSMANLPHDLGISIFKQILNSPAPDREALRTESQRLVSENVKVRERGIAQKNSAK